jgi:hypothetical protein
LLWGYVVHSARSSWIRGLRLYRATADAAPPEPAEADGIQARSRFRSVRHPDRRAEYTLRAPGEPPTEPMGRGDHTLAVVREFRRVPLRASGLGLVVFAARLGREAHVVATLAHFAERALSVYQPAYLLLGRSIEQPGIIALITGVEDRRVLDGREATPFSVEEILRELAPFLAGEPDRYAYAPDAASDAFDTAVSRYAV